MVSDVNALIHRFKVDLRQMLPFLCTHGAHYVQLGTINLKNQQTISNSKPNDFIAYWFKTSFGLIKNLKQPEGQRSESRR